MRRSVLTRAPLPPGTWARTSAAAPWAARDYHTAVVLAPAIVLMGGTVLDQLNMLPWGQVLSEAEAKLVGFLIAAGMMILHVYDMTKNPAPPTPPAA